MAREPTNAPVHLRPHAPVAERVLLPGDPGRALRLAQVLIEGPKMLNHNRGLWGYTGPAADGRPLTIQSTGMGGPSAAIIVEELIALGARRLVRIGTCSALDGALRTGDLVVADPVLAGDGVSRAFGAPDELSPDPRLSASLIPAAAAVGRVLSADLFYGEPTTSSHALARDLESAAVLAVAARRGVAAAAVLLVVEDASGDRLDDPEALHAAEIVLGRAGAAAVGAA
jgi:uridine phosphorylase